MEPTVVAISGDPGSGTTTLSRLLSKALGWPHVHAGEVFRSLARERGMDLESFCRYAEENPEVDRLLDERMIEVARRGRVVLEGRLAAFHARQASVPSLRVLLVASEGVRAERVARREGSTPSEALLRNRERERSEIRRYREIYGIDPHDPALYDLVLSSEENPPKELLRIVLERMGRASGKF